MFTIDAFGRRVRCMPRLMFTGAGDGGSGANDGGTGNGDLGFPANTPVAEMKPEEQAAYWKNQSKTQQAAREAAERERDAFKPKAEQFDTLEQQSKTEQEKAVDAAREEARREGEVIGAEKYLKDAVKGRFQALTGKTDEEVETAFAHVDASSFVDSQGAIDVESIKKFAATFGSNAGGGAGSSDPVAEALRRQQAGGGSGSGNTAGSVADIRAQRREALTGGKK